MVEASESRVLVLLSDTGGGHRAAAEAIAAAMAEIAPKVSMELVDGLVEAGTWPLNHSPQIYSWLIDKARVAWWSSFHSSNSPLRSRLMVDLAYPLTGKRIRRLIERYDPDIIVSVHPLLTRSITKTLVSMGRNTPLAIVVTDLVTGHWSWFERAAQALLLPTEACRDRLLEAGYDPETLQVVGQPLHPRCARAVDRREQLRELFGWKEPTILLMGGGEGIGGLHRYAFEADRAGLKARLVIVCGRNESLKARLEKHEFTIPVQIHGFVHNLPELCAASDILVTKGGPGSIMEGCVAGLPLVLYDYVPGQEWGNIELVRDAGAGVFCRKPKDVVAVLQNWIDDPELRKSIGDNARALAIPDSAHRIARAIIALDDRQPQHGLKPKPARV